MAITKKNKEEIVLLHEGGKRLAGIVASVVEAARPGVSADILDKLAERLIRESGGTPSFKGYRPVGASTVYPAAICVSVNDEVVHGIPRREKILQEGDVVGIDIGMWWPSSVGATESKFTDTQALSDAPIARQRGLCTDMAVTIGIGHISKEARQLLRITKESLDLGIAAAKIGNTVGDIGYAVEHCLKKYRYGIVRDLAGHGVGYKVHEEPLIPNYGKAKTGAVLQEGMVIAIEPMATLGDWRVVLQKDKWTFKTIDNTLAAHFEHTVAVGKNGGEILTLY